MRCDEHFRRDIVAVPPIPDQRSAKQIIEGPLKTLLDVLFYWRSLRVVLAASFALSQ